MYWLVERHVQLIIKKVTGFIYALIARVQYPRITITAAAAINGCEIPIAFYIWLNTKRRTNKKMNLYRYINIYIIWSPQQVNICILYTVHIKLSNNGTDSLSIVGTSHDENIERTTYHHFNSFQFHLIFVHNWIGWVQFQFLAVVHLIANRYLDCIARYALHAVPIFFLNSLVRSFV